VMSEHEAMSRQPSVLLVYYTFTQQALKVAEAMAGVFRERGCSVTLAKIEFTDERWVERFSRFPFKRPWPEVLGMFVPQMRGATGEIEIPKEAAGGEYDLVCIGSPTWFFRPSIPIRSYLESEEAGAVLDGKPFAIYVVCRRYWSINMKGVRKLAKKKGGEYVDNIHFVYAGRQIRSFLSLFGYFTYGENREKYAGVKIPPTNLQPGYEEQACAFARRLADGLEAPAPPAGDPSLSAAPA
jgi:menaquinone-dependent protoporphyrinogen IX oxidase